MMFVVNMIHGWFALWGAFFWLFFGLDVLFLAFFVPRKSVAAVFWGMTAFVVACLVFSDVTWAGTVGYLWSHWRHVLSVVGGYLVTGAVASVYQYYLLNAENSEKIFSLRAAWLRKQGVTQPRLLDGLDELPPDLAAKWGLYLDGDPNAKEGEWLWDINGDYRYEATKGDTRVRSLYELVPVTPHANELAAIVACPWPYLLYWFFDRFLSRFFDHIVRRLRRAYEWAGSLALSRVRRDIVAATPPVARPQRDVDFG